VAKDNGKRGRKIGTNKKSPSMMAYKASGRLEKNKARRKRTHEADVTRKAEKIAKRIKLGKPVHKRHTKTEA
jgi:hypothetical protein